MPASSFETIQVGDSHSVKRVLTKDDVRTFAEITGDDNPIHLDEEYAKQTRFGKPVVHGVLLLGIISKVLGHDFPGAGSIAVTLSCRFLRPVPVGSEIDVEIQVTDKLPEKRQVKARVYVHYEEGMAMGGKATLIPPGEEKENGEKKEDA